MDPTVWVGPRILTAARGNGIHPRHKSITLNAAAARFVRILQHGTVVYLISKLHISYITIHVGNKNNMKDSKPLIFSFNVMPNDCCNIAITIKKRLDFKDLAKIQTWVSKYLQVDLQILYISYISYQPLFFQPIQTVFVELPSLFCFGCRCLHLCQGFVSFFHPRKGLGKCAEEPSPRTEKGYI